eukprot:CAMPEP_0201133562 /NCGR_PEP_ID=MMETSP0850-20130426/49191_1 /ASSEMBLY_ACC=CAM_ASM_000622 /TAXON_ID=183588 /ORGANISM="Pseudo-nitzschia fraudulenta, Strain WWA7" /LENGTH=236 /DNA_ID=CAMNT_0047404241 /DNA_START=23 /DNA_END=729 /DNA_ORIENTATION=-
MSLSFVSSAVQIGTSNGGFEETAIENKETEAVNRRNAHKPLFEQLRSNQEEDEEKKDEAQRLIMRSTCALNDEDVAHLDSLERQRTDRERKIQERTNNEVENFRAAKALRKQATLVDDDDDDNEGIDSKNVDPSDPKLPASGNGAQSLAVEEKSAPLSTTSLPVIKVKKRKRRIDPTDTAGRHEHTEKKILSEQEVGAKSELREVKTASSKENNATLKTKRTEPTYVAVKQDVGVG